MAAHPGRGFDHLVLCVRDIEAAREAYTHFGFTVTPRALHPFGTGNSLVQLHGAYLELLTVVDPSKIGPPGRDFPFAAYNRAFLRDREGMSMLALASADARADCGEFAVAGLETYPPFEFSRKARLPDGGEAELSFALAFVADPGLPETVFFTCQHKTPQLIWRPEYQIHGNGAHAVLEVVMITADPFGLADFFSRLQGRDAVRFGDGRIDVATARGTIAVLSPQLARERFPGAPFRNELDPPAFAGYRLAVHDLEAVRMRFDAGNVRYRMFDGALQVAPADAFGVCLEFIAG